MTDELDPRATPTPAPDAAEVASPAMPAPDVAEAAASAVPASDDPGDLALLGLIDRLAAVLDRSDLSELEVQVGGTGLVLRKPVAIAPPVVAPAGPAAPAAPPAAPPAGAEAGASGPTRPTVRAPLTGIWYAAPSPGSAPYVTVGGELAAGQVVGLIEAMKLFNEIKSDVAGRVVKIHPEPGTLVKAKQPLIEVEPL